MTPTASIAQHHTGASLVDQLNATDCFIATAEWLSDLVTHSTVWLTTTGTIIGNTTPAQLRREIFSHLHTWWLLDGTLSPECAVVEAFLTETCRCTPAVQAATAACQALETQSDLLRPVIGGARPEGAERILANIDTWFGNPFRTIGNLEVDDLDS